MSFPEVIVRNRAKALRRAPAIVLLVLCSCLGSILDDGLRTDGFMEVRVRECSVRSFTKANRLSGCEEASSGAIIAIYRTLEGTLEEVVEAVPGRSLNLKKGVEYDFFLLGNLNAIRLSDGKAVNLYEALGRNFPASRDVMLNFEYMLDGAVNVGTGWRRESAADVASLGIPFAGKRLAVTPETLTDEGGLSFNDASYLFAKVRVTVDHSLLDHGDTSAEDWFRNVSLSTRQVNARLCPFSSTIPYARTSADIIGSESAPVTFCFDYDAELQNGSQVSYLLYVPANAQGALLDGNTDANRKTPAGLYEAGCGEKSSLCTYIEFIGKVSSAAGGFGGDVKYRFYLGADTCSDFSVLPGIEYQVRLTLTVGGVFGDSWKVTNSMTDRRELRLYRTSSYTGELSDGEKISLKKGIDTEIYVKCDDGSGKDLMQTSSYDGAIWSPLGLDDLGLECSFLNAVDGDSVWMKTCGIAVRWNPVKRCFSFSVENESLFRSHCGESRQMEIYAIPGDGRCVRAFTLELTDASVAIVGGIAFVAKPSYVGSWCRITHEHLEFLDDQPTEVSVIIDGAYIGDYDLAEDGVIDFGRLAEGEHVVDLEVIWHKKSVWDMVSFEVYATPKVSVSFGQRSMQATGYKNVVDDDGNPYIVHRRSWDKLWVEFSPQGRYDSFDVRMNASCGYIYSKSGKTVYVSSTGLGSGEMLVDFTLGDSVYTVSVPYVSYEEVTFRAAESHGALVLINNNVSVGWETLTNTMTGTLYASVRWSLKLSLICSDGTRVSGNWGPFTDTSMTVADGSRHLRNFHDEFKALRKSFENGHRLQDADRLEGAMTLRVTFGKQYYLATVTGATFADFYGLVEATSTTPSAHPLLRHWAENSSRFYGLKS